MTKEILLQHYKDYPKARLQDFFVLIHQSEFGSSLSIADFKENSTHMTDAKIFLKDDEFESFIEVLSPQLCRLYLQILNQTSLQARTFYRFLELSANKARGHSKSYNEKIKVLSNLCVSGDLPFTKEDVDNFKAKKNLRPSGIFSHSKNYLEAYPATYQIVEKQFCDVLSLFIRIDELVSRKEGVVIAIDGDCTAGKTTLANLIKRVYTFSEVIHMDHFFLRPEQRIEARLDEPGGNIDHERFVDDVLVPLKSNQKFSYRPLNCMSKSFDEPISVSPSKLTIIEGSYSHHPSFIECYDLKVFLSIPEEAQLERVLKRNGEAMYKKFKSTWIPLEKHYATTFDILQKSDLSFDFLDNL